MLSIKHMALTILCLQSFVGAAALAQTKNVSSAELLKALQAGGNVIVMR